MKCEQDSNWIFRLSGGAREVRVRIAIVFQIPIPREEEQGLVSVSILAAYELFPDELPWEVKVKLRSAIANGFHVGLGFTGLPTPADGIDFGVTDLEIVPSPVALDDAEMERLADAIYWAAAGMAMSCWRGLHALSADASP